MQKYTGKTVYSSIAMGPVHVIRNTQEAVSRSHVDDTAAELARVEKACETAKEQLQVLYDKAMESVGEASAALFEVHQMMIDDDDFREAIQGIIESESVNAEYAVAVTGDNFSRMFAEMDDEYFKARSADIKDISERIVRCLQGRGEADFTAADPCVIVAEDLTPSETVRMDKDKVLAFVTVHGSTNSHTAILARMMNIPALIGVPLDLDSLESGTLAVVDGFAGEVIFDPDEEEKTRARQRIREEAEKATLLRQLKNKETVTKSGQKVNLYANIGNVGDLGYVLENNAEGIGLFRSEFLYLGRDDFPTEEEQFAAYKQVLQTMGTKKVIIRTMDIGADKKVDYFHLDPEENPALGYRAIRICLTRPEIFRTQLRALFRASCFGNLAIMYPMITSVEEVQKIYEAVDAVKAELTAEGIPFGEPEQGIMIETPAAAIISDELAQLVDFFSIGTNDLTQYTLAVDRQNDKLDAFCNTHHPAILRLIAMVTENAHKYGKWAGICGELGADLTLTEEFVRMGVDELSVSPGMVLKVREKIRGIE